MKNVTLEQYLDLLGTSTEVQVLSGDGHQVYQGSMADYFNANDDGDSIAKSTKDIDVLTADINEGRLDIRLNVRMEDLVFGGEKAVLNQAFEVANELADELRGVQLHEFADERKENKYAKLYERLYKLAKRYVEECK